MMKLLPYLFCSLILFPVSAQKMNARVSESQLLIGQPVALTYSVKTDLNDSIYFTPKSAEIEARSTTKTGALSSEGISFDIINEFRDTFIFHNDYKEWIGQYVITAWDSGVYILPGPNIVINDSTYLFNDITIMCHLVDPIDGMDIYDIKENFAEIPAKPFSLSDFLKKNWWWLSLTVVALGVIWFLVRRKKDEPEEEERPLSLKERTLIAINALENAKYWEKEKLKEHFIELSYILRAYLTSRYGISLLEKTTYETKLLLTQKGLNQDTVDTIARILSQSDMVKFAKSNPDAIAILRISTLAKQIVAETSPLEFDNVE